jgi:hypothetical protein
MYPEFYYTETEEWRKTYREALKELDKLYPETIAYDSSEEVRPTSKSTITN